VVDAIVCPHCNTVLRNDPELEEVGSERERSRYHGFMILGAVIAFGVMAAVVPRFPWVGLLSAAAYIVAFKFCAKRADNLSATLTLSIFVWMGLFSVVAAVFLFAGCLVGLGR